MDKETLKKNILSLLKTSYISDHQKKMTRILIDTLSAKQLNDIYLSLRSEKKDLMQLDNKDERIILKYSVLNEKLESIRKNSKQ